MTRILVLGAHPDDAEFFAGGLLSRQAKHGATLRLVSVTNGQSGHHEMTSDTLVVRRRNEAANAGAVIGAEYVTWDFPDGSLQPTLELRTAIIREIRSFEPELILTHRTLDYHPDHRAVGQAVQDASYMVMVPKIAPGHATPKCEPIVAYMNDLFTRPCPLRADIVIDVSNEFERAIDMMHCHVSQFYEWMPWIDRTASTLPSLEGCNPSQAESLLKEWLRKWYLERTSVRLTRFWQESFGPAPKLVEAFEISEYAGKPSKELLDRLFPGRV